MHISFASVKAAVIKYVSLLWKFFAGAALALGVAANFTDLKRSDITVEITSVATASSEPIDLMRVSDLAAVKEFIASGIGIFSLPLPNAHVPAMSVEEIDRQMQIASNAVKANNEKIDGWVRGLENVISGGAADKNGLLDEIARESLFVPAIDPTFDISDMRVQRKPLSDKQRFDAQIAHIRSQIAQHRKNVDVSMLKKANAEKQWSEYKERILPNKARLVVTCAIGNKGSGATAIKPQAILRANLGAGNYLDLPMKLSGYDSSQDIGVIQPHSYKVVRLQSDEVQSMTAADRQRYTTFLGNVSPATVYISDVNSKVYASNSVPFSPGVYEQKVYDLLKQFATDAKQR